QADDALTINLDQSDEAAQMKCMLHTYNILFAGCVNIDRNLIACVVTGEFNEKIENVPTTQIIATGRFSRNRCCR
ncbi:hypothetical protein, partial [Ruegeria sp. HKCCA5426]|uniref:hypothetical protein n=1 Tax=Ruegeria sp. HKCCA5426 TaxID=2682985 RepID=UPI001C2C940C